MCFLSVGVIEILFGFVFLSIFVIGVEVMYVMVVMGSSVRDFSTAISVLLR